MAKVFGKIIEEEVTFLTNPDIEFVSLVKYAANRMPFKIIKQEGNMSEMLYRVLVPKDLEQDKLEELAKQYSFSIEKEEEGEFKQYRVFTQKDIEKAEEKESALIALDKENKIYAVVVAEKKEDIAKQYDTAQTLDDVLRAMYSMEEIIYGALTQPAAKQEERIDMVKKAIQNFLDFATNVLQTTKAEDVAEFEGVEKEEAEIKVGDIVASVVDKITEKQKEVEKEIENIKKELQETLEQFLTSKLDDVQKTVKEEADAFITKSTFDTAISELKGAIESVTAVIKKGSEVDETKTKKIEKPKVEKSSEFKFYTAI